MNAALARKHATGSPAYAASGPAIVVQPTTPKEIIEILQNPKRFPSPVRPQGSGSSVTRCVTAHGGTVIDMTALRAWCRHTGNYPAVETINRWLRMSPRQRANVLKALKEAGRLPKEETK